MDHGTRDKSARLILASVPVQALLMAGVLALALGGRSAAPAPDGAYYVKPAQRPATCGVAVLSPQGWIVKQSGPVPCPPPPGKPAPAQGSLTCGVAVLSSRGWIVELTGPASSGSQIDSKVLAIGAARCAVGSIDSVNGSTPPGKPLPPALPAKP